MSKLYEYYTISAVALQVKRPLNIFKLSFKKLLSSALTRLCAKNDNMHNKMLKNLLQLRVDLFMNMNYTCRVNKCNLGFVAFILSCTNALYTVDKP